MVRRASSKGWIVLLVAVALLTGCGGGGEAPQAQAPPPAGPVSLLLWAAPATFNDNTPLNPSVDIDYYELYLRSDTNFTEVDQPVVEVAAVVEQPSPDGRSVLRSPVTQFILDVIPSIPDGELLYVSVRAVGIDRQKSAFMSPVAWDRS